MNPLRVLTSGRSPLKCSVCAGIAQLVEHDLAKVGVASSSLVSRSKIERTFDASRTCTKKGPSAPFFMAPIWATRVIGGVE